VFVSNPGALAGGFDLEIGSLAPSSWVSITPQPTSSSEVRTIEAAANLEGEAIPSWSSILIMDMLPVVLHLNSQ
jgi:hypothetical protein